MKNAANLSRPYRGPRPADDGEQPAETLALPCPGCLAPIAVEAEVATVDGGEWHSACAVECEADVARANDHEDPWRCARCAEIAVHDEGDLCGECRMARAESVCGVAS